MLELINISKSYQAPAGMPAEPVLQNINLKLNPGESLAVTGPSGCGKTTLLNIIGCLDKPTSGEVMFKGEDIASYSETRQAEYRRNNIGIVFQDHNLLPQCTVLENMLLPILAGNNIASNSDIEHAQNLLDMVGLADRSKYFPGQLSGGQCQRVALARAFVNRPDLILADEPTGSLDRNNAETVINLICELTDKQNTAAIVVTHDPAIAQRMTTQFPLN